MIILPLIAQKARAFSLTLITSSILTFFYVNTFFHRSNHCATSQSLRYVDPSQRLSIRQLRESDFLRNQHFPLSVPKYKLSQGIKDTTVDETSKERTVQSVHKLSLSLDEKEAYRQLSHLGINDAMINESRDKGVRSNVIGTYRIILHRIVSHRYAANRSKSQNSSASSSRSERQTKHEASLQPEPEAKQSPSNDGQQEPKPVQAVPEGCTETAVDIDRCTNVRSVQNAECSSSNNNTPLCSTTFYCGVPPGDEDGFRVDCCPCRPSRPLSNNYFEQYVQESSKKKRKKFAKGCVVL